MPRIHPAVCVRGAERRVRLSRRRRGPGPGRAGASETRRRSLRPPCPRAPPPALRPPGPLASARRGGGQRAGRCLAAIPSAFLNALPFSASRSSLRNVRRRVSPDALLERRHVCRGQQHARRLHLPLSPGECASPARGPRALPCRLPRSGGQASSSQAPRGALSVGRVSNFSSCGRLGVSHSELLR